MHALEVYHQRIPAVGIGGEQPRDLGPVVVEQLADGGLDVGGLDLAMLFRLLGVGVILFGALCAFIASRNPLPSGLARIVFAADIAWVAGSAVVLLLPASWTTMGVAGIAVVALIVADLAILEYLGLRRLDAAR